ncbi:hypothetical protein I4U23_004396 [Adineta vaga]|nr:hypothetical protein I4U23_004396 [Adineta vaga]
MKHIPSHLIFLATFLSITYSSHFRGGTITWRPWNNTPSGSTVSILFRQRYSWRRLSVPCYDSTISSKGLIGSGSCTCVSGPCPTWSAMSTSTHCTDYSSILDVSSGERYELRTIPLNMSFSIAFPSGDWFANLAKGGNSVWRITNRVSTFFRPDGYLNSSPVAVTLPIIYKEINIQHVHVIQMSDFDGTDTLKCRWSNGSTNTINGFDECGGVCNGVLISNLIEENCTIVFTLTVSGQYSAVALQIEDYYNDSQIVPMSSVPLQLLFYGYTKPSGCSTPPEIIGARPNRVHCSGSTITDFVSSSPVGMIKSPILNPSPNIYHLVVSWIPTSDQYGPQPFCVGAVDSNSLQSIQWCITYLVGFESPQVIKPQVVQGSASPVCTIFKNHTVFSIQTTRSVNRPTRNGTFIYFWNASAGGTLVRKFDCGWESEVTYTGFTTIIRFPTAPWTEGHFFYVTMDGGVASGTDFCGPESDAITSNTFWIFNIWNPAVSSTTTTTTTPFTTVTVTTKPTSTTSINTLLTTTGIVITTTVPLTTILTTTTTTIATTVASTSAGSTLSSATTESTVAIMYPKDFKDACKQPIIILTVATMAIMAPIQALTMYAAFTKFSSMFNPLHTNYLCDSTAKCGCSHKSPVLKRIISRELNTESYWRWVVSIKHVNQFTCGGSILSNSWILTSATCVNIIPPQYLSISAGSNNIQFGKQIRSAAKIIIHPKFNSTDNTNDIALIHLETPLDMDDLSVASICLPSQTSKSYSQEISSLISVGWGVSHGLTVVSPNEKGYGILREIPVRAVSNDDEECKSLIHDNTAQLCAQVDNSQQDTCAGDAGNPLMMYTSSRQWTVVGLVSYGIGCDGTYPSVYTRVSNYLDWIKSNVEDAIVISTKK